MMCEIFAFRSCHKNKGSLFSHSRVTMRKELDLTTLIVSGLNTNCAVDIIINQRQFCLINDLVLLYNILPRSNISVYIYMVLLCIYSITVVTCHVPAYDSVAGLNGSCPALGSVEWMDNCSFACADGYQIEGAPQMTCRASGNFSAEVPNCICKFFKTHSNIACQ